MHVCVCAMCGVCINMCGYVLICVCVCVCVCVCLSVCYSISGIFPLPRKFPELFASFKTLLGFKDPGLPEQLPTTSPAPPFPPKERVTDFAAEIGELACEGVEVWLCMEVMGCV